MREDYSSYRLTWRERIRYAILALLLTGILAYLFYASLWVMILTPVTVAIIFRQKKKTLAALRRKRIEKQFQNMLSSLCVALRAGYAMENALGECRKDLEKLYGGQAELVQELRYMEGQIRVSVPVEGLLDDMGRRTGVEDIQNFAGIYTIAKRTGGNLEQVLQNTAGKLREKMETAEEIEASLAAKKMEQRLMGMMPCAIILYLRLFSPGFLDPLYGNLLGAAVMTGCLGLYGIALKLGERIVDIEV